MAAESPPVEILPWLRSLPVAPEYHPTLSEFQDPIAYILKIEKEASAYGICKIVPPIPAAPKKTAFANLNKSFAAHLPTPSPRPNPSPDSNSKRSPTFSTRHQQIGFCNRRPRSVQKPVWQSGDRYTLTQFEAKAKHFELSYLSKFTPMAAAASYCSPSRKKKKNKFKNRQKKSSKMSLSPLSALQLETLYWKACADKPFSVEYANDIPGSGFPPIVGVTGKRWREDEVADNLAETAWNMRGVSRAKGSLLRFMKEEIPGVTSPMVYVAMLFSWFAWHVEDHELHSLNYLHLGAGKTWYGVPRDAALAFEDVVRVHGYCGEVNPLMTFTILGEKTTVMSPEVLIDAGIPCCRLVQNAGEFVITFPGAYHCGFSHGFNCGEAANIATPRWLRVAKEAAIRRASTNYPPMVSHFQLLYALALSLCSRMPLCGNNEPRSSRIKDKLSGEGELIIKKTFVQSVVDNNALLSYLLEKGSSCIVLPQITEDSPLSSSSLIRSQLKVKPRLSLKLCSREEALEASRALPTDDINLDMNTGMKHLTDFSSLKGNSVAVYHRKKHAASSNDKSVTSEVASSILELHSLVEEKERNLQGDGLLDQGLLSCVTCGILSFACVAVVEPREAAARYLTSACCSFLIEQHTGSEEISDVAHDTNLQSSNICSGRLEGEKKDRLDENTVYNSKYSSQILDPIEVGSENSKQKGTSALDLLASVYGDESSDSDNEQLPHETSVCTQESYPKKLLLSHKLDNDHVATKLPDLWFGKVPYSEVEHELIGANCQNAVPAENFRYTNSDDLDNLSERADDRYLLKLESSRCYKPEYKDSLLLRCMEDNGQVTNSSNSIRSLVGEIDFSNKELGSCNHTTGTLDVHRTNMKTQSTTPCSNDLPLCADPRYEIDTHCENAYISTHLKKYHSDMKKVAIDVMHGSDKDSSRMHVFCLQHAMEVERKLCSVGGIHIMLLCHPDYPKIEAEAKALAVELGIDYEWNDIDFREATLKDQERIQAALKDEESIPTNSDWAVKLGINLYYSASLSKSPLYSKQMPYNAVIYKSFSFNSPNNTTVKTKGFGRPGRQKKIVVAGKWCGSIWMSNQVHPFLVQRKDAQDEEAGEVPFTHGCIANSNSIIGSESKGSSANDSSTVSRKPGKRKTRPLRKANGKKPKLSQSTDILNVIENDVKVYNTSRGRILRSNNKLKNKDEPERGPSSRLRRRPMRSEDTKVVKPVLHKQNERKATGGLAPKSCDDDDEGEYTCDIDGCYMSFSTKQELSLHKRNICPFKGCGKKLFSHKYMLQHRKVHMDYRPLECPWKGCKMTFKWAWARTEHIRVHTGDRPYICHEPGCSQTFRFVSDFSRHKRKTGHSVKKFRRC